MEQAKIDEILSQLSMNLGEEYHKLHIGKMPFEEADARMKFYENQAKQALAAWVRSKKPHVGEETTSQTEEVFVQHYKSVDEYEQALLADLEDS